MGWDASPNDGRTIPRHSFCEPPSSRNNMSRCTYQIGSGWTCVVVRLVRCENLSSRLSLGGGTRDQTRSDSFELVTDGLDPRADFVDDEARPFHQLA